MADAAVRLQNVSKAFDGRPVLNQVSFSVAPGEAFCLLGRSGTGKSVTLKLIIGLLALDDGTVFIDADGDGLFDENERSVRTDVNAPFAPSGETTIVG